jgi:hypothetical protein
MANFLLGGHHWSPRHAMADLYMHKTQDKWVHAKQVSGAERVESSVAYRLSEKRERSCV